MKKLLILAILAILFAVSVSAVKLDADITLDWISGDAVNIKVEGGDSRLFVCSDVTSANYNAYDTVLEARVDLDGKRYYSDVTIDWLNSHAFMIRTEDRDWGFDCNDVNETNYNSFDDVLNFDFESSSKDSGLSDAEAAEIEAIMDAVIRNYINYSTNISECEKKIVELTGKLNNMEDKWRTCEQESGAIKEQNKQYQRELDSTQRELSSAQAKINETLIKLRNAKQEVQNTQTACQSQTQQKDQEIALLNQKVKELEDKNDKMVAGGLIALVAFLIFRGRKSDKTTQPEVEEGITG